jgi:hypothetical protein
MRTCDKLFSELIRTRDDWMCRACGSVRLIQCGHLVSRRYRATRWAEDNAVALCSRCHMRWTHDPLGWEAWCDERWPGRLSMLKRVARAKAGWVDYVGLAESLTSQLEALRERRTA